MAALPSAVELVKPTVVAWLPTAVEFAMIITPFLGLLFAIVETALVFWSTQVLEGSLLKLSIARTRTAVSRMVRRTCATTPATRIASSRRWMARAAGTPALNSRCWRGRAITHWWRSGSTPASCTRSR